MHDLPPRLDFEPVAGGQRLVLPPRRGGLGAPIAIAFGTCFAAIPGYHLAYPAVEKLRQQGPSTSAFVDLLFAAPFVFIGTTIALSTLGLWLSRTTLRIVGDELIVREGVGPFAVQRRRHADDFTGFHVGVGTSRTNDGPTRPIEKHAALTASQKNSNKPFIIAVGQSRSLLLDVAERLADQFQTSGRLGPERELPVTEKLAQPLGFPNQTTGYQPDEPVPDQPEKSNATVERSPHQTTYHLPPMGFRGPVLGLVFFAAVWNTITLAMLAAQLTGNIQSADTGEPMPAYVAVPFFAVFLTVGLAALVYTLRLATRQTRITVEQHHRDAQTSLVIQQTAFLNQRQFTFDATDLAGLRVGKTGSSTNNKPNRCLKLQIQPDADSAVQQIPSRHDRKKATLPLLQQRNTDELRWLAARLRHDLKLPHRPPTTEN